MSDKSSAVYQAQTLPCVSASLSLNSADVNLQTIRGSVADESCMYNVHPNCPSMSAAFITDCMRHQSCYSSSLPSHCILTPFLQYAYSLSTVCLLPFYSALTPSIPLLFLLPIFSLYPYSLPSPSILTASLLILFVLPRFFFYSYTV